MNRLLILALIELLLVNIGISQPAEFNVKEKKLVELSKNIWNQKTDSLKIAHNMQFMTEYLSVLKSPGAFSYPFDSLITISRLKPADGSFRISTWNIPLSDGKFKFYGVIEKPGNADISVLVFENQQSSSVLPYDSRLPLSQWYGAIYYQLIEKTWKGKTQYILLGWNGKDRFSNCKIIDALSFEADGIWFGAPIFKTKEGLRNRAVMEYAERAVMLVKYDRQTLLVAKGNKVKPIKEWMIIMDRLVPTDPSFEGDYRYYIPAGDTYDAFVFRDGKWVFAEDVMATNPPPAKK